MQHPQVEGSQKGKSMSYTFSSMIRIFLIQCLLTALLAMPFREATASPHKEVVGAKVNSYLFDGEQIDLKHELMLESGKKVKVLRLRAQGIENDAKIAIEINKKKKLELPLSNQMRTLQLKVEESIESLTVSSNAAFLRSVKAKLDEQGDQPHPEDIGRRSLLVRILK